MQWTTAQYTYNSACFLKLYFPIKIQLLKNIQETHLEKTGHKSKKKAYFSMYYSINFKKKDNHTFQKEKSAKILFK